MAVMVMCIFTYRGGSRKTGKIDFSHHRLPFQGNSANTLNNGTPKPPNLPIRLSRPRNRNPERNCNNNENENPKKLKSTEKFNRPQ